MILIFTLYVHMKTKTKCRVRRCIMWLRCVLDQAQMVAVFCGVANTRGERWPRENCGLICGLRMRKKDKEKIERYKKRKKEKKKK